MPPVEVATPSVTSAATPPSPPGYTPAPDPTPASPLLVRSGRSTLVATDALLANLPELDAFADAIESDAHRIAVLALDTPHGILRTRLDRCEVTGLDLADEVRTLRRAIAIAQSSYELGERTVVSLQDAASAWTTGVFARFAAPFLPLMGLGGAILWKRMPGTDDQKKAVLQRWLLDHPEVLTSPEFSTVVRRVVSNTDDAVLGASGLPPWVAMVLGEQGLGILSVSTSAGVLIGVGSAIHGRAFHETPVNVERVSTQTTATAPTGAEQRLARVPAEEQVRIEQYTAPGEPTRYVVYVAPTQTFAPIADQEPWDLTSNVAGVAGLPAGSIRATEQAMADAGITADSEIVLVGFSQGGLVADAVAASGDWNAVGLETYGDPGGGIELPEGISGLAVRHTDDFVVATGGEQLPTDRTIVERQAYPDGSDIPTDLPVPAHQRRAYAETARLLDAAESSEVRAQLDAIDAFTHEYTSREGSQITTYSYRAERAPTR